MAEFLERIGEKVRTLSDLELAVLLCLVSDRHCIIQTEEDLLDAVENELHIVCYMPLLATEFLTFTDRD
jgi:hypothetical protein